MSMIVTQILVAAVALLHVWFMVLEMFLWTKPLGLKTFNQTEAQAQSSRVLAANQGLYNGFLAAGLFYGLITPIRATGSEFVLFFLCCVLVAGVYGGITASRKILWVQALPAAIAIVAMLIQLFS